MFNKVRVIHLAVNDLDAAIKDFQHKYGFKVTRQGEVAQLGISNAFLQFGDAVIELLQPLKAGEGPVAKFLETRGEGVYMMGWEVDNLDSAIRELQQRGIRLINADPQTRATGVPVFIHPKSAHGLMIELLEKGHD